MKLKIDKIEKANKVTKTGDVVTFDDISLTRSDISTSSVLEAAKDSCANGMVVVIGYDDDGDFYFASSSGDCEKIDLLMDEAKKVLSQQDSIDNKIEKTIVEKGVVDDN